MLEVGNIVRINNNYLYAGHGRRGKIGIVESLMVNEGKKTIYNVKRFDEPRDVGVYYEEELQVLSEHSIGRSLYL